MKENDKVLVLKLLLKATFVLLSMSVILKLLGLNIFGADTSNAILISISNFIDRFHLKNPIDWCLLFIQYYLYFKIVCTSKDSKSYVIIAFIKFVTNPAIVIPSFCKATEVP